MQTETQRPPSVLTAEELDAFQRQGYVRVKAAFPRELARAMQDEIWNELREEHGIERSNRGTWRTLPRSPRRAKELPLNSELASERFQGVISDLLGYEDWPRPRTWGGFLVNFPDETRSSWELRADGWHWDGAPESEGLLVFSFYSEVRPGGGGTLILGGSPRLIGSFYDSLPPDVRAKPHKVHRKLFARWDPWLEALNGISKEPVEDRISAFMERTTEVRGVPCQVVELTGEPGDAVFCNLGMLHSVSHNCADVPRFMRVKFLFVES